MKYVISDLHLGCGDARDDFLFIGSEGSEDMLLRESCRRDAIQAMHLIFERFLEHILAATTPDKPELVLLGDIFDLLQVEPVEAEFRNPARLEKIFDAHQPFFNALNRFADRGGTITYVIGNHDHEMVDPSMFQKLREILPSINQQHRGKPLVAYSDDEWGLYGEHGNQFDPMNRFMDIMNPDELPVGSVVVLKVVNPFEPNHPLFDNIQGTCETLWYAGRILPAVAAPEILEHAMEHQQAHGGMTASLINHLLYILTGKGVLDISPAYLPLISQAVMTAESVIRSILLKKKKTIRKPNEIKLLSSAFRDEMLLAAERMLKHPEKASLLSRTPRRLNVFLCGHTHEPLLLKTEHGIYANSGCWRPCAVARYKNIFRIIQSLNYVVIRRKKNGDIGVAIRDFARLKERH